ncbi:hypothetical protein Hanom_Chr10g00917811 [Helianthus anomalus]
MFQISRSNNFFPKYNISLFFLNGKERRVNHHDTGRRGQGRLFDRRQPLALPDARKPDLQPSEGMTVK